MRYLTWALLLMMMGSQVACTPAPSGVSGGCQSEARGCFTFQFFAVEDADHPLLNAVKSGEKRIHEVALDVWRAVERGDIRLVSVNFMLYTFDMDTRESSRVTVYENAGGGRRLAHRAVALHSRQVPPLPQGLSAPSAVYALHAHGKPAMLAMPDSMFTEKSAVMFCAPDEPTVVPSQARQEGVWIPSSALPWHRAQGTWSMTFVIVRPKK